MTQKPENLLRLRLLLVSVALAAFIAALIIGSMTALTTPEARMINEEVNSSLPHDRTFWPLTSAIFLNNFRIALFGLIPFLIGAGLLLLIGYSTGVVFSANAIASGASITGLESLFIVMLFPFFFWELSSYALTMMQGIIITRGLIKGGRIERFIAPRHFRDGELFKTALTLALSALVLLIGALMESYLIVYFLPSL